VSRRDGAGVSRISGHAVGPHPLAALLALFTVPLVGSPASSLRLGRNWATVSPYAPAA